MGCYDFLNDGQVRCFFDGIVLLSDENKDKVEFGRVGGSFTTYKDGMEVPYYTPCYNYGKDFFVYDNRYEENNPSPWAEEYSVLHEIRGGKLYKSYMKDDIRDDMVFNNIIDYSGRELKIKTIKDIHAFKADFDDLVVDKFLGGMSKLNTKFKGDGHEKECNTQYRNEREQLKNKSVIAFYKKWTNEDNRFWSNNIGILMDYEINEPVERKYDKEPFKMYHDTSETFKDEVVEYLKWLKDTDHPEKDSIKSHLSSLLLTFGYQIDEFLED